MSRDINMKSQKLVGYQPSVSCTLKKLRGIDTPKRFCQHFVASDNFWQMGVSSLVFEIFQN